MLMLDSIKNDVLFINVNSLNKLYLSINY